MIAKTAFKYWASIHLHFKSFDYEMQKYGINTKANENKWNKLSENQRFKFDWLSRTYINDTELVYTCIATELAGLNIQYALKQDIQDVSGKFRGRRDSVTYYIQNDIDNMNDQTFDKVVMNYVSGKCTPEYVLLLDPNLDKLKIIRDSRNFSFISSDVNKLIKYRTFFNPTKYQQLLT